MIPASGSGPLFRDDFDGEMQPGWLWPEEESTNASHVQGGWLRIDGASGPLEKLDIPWGILPGGAVQITIHLASRPLFESQRAGLVLYADAAHYVALSRGYCDGCVLGGSGVFLEYHLGNQVGRYAQRTQADDLYLMLISEPGVVSGFFAEKPGQWKHMGSIANQARFERLGLEVTSGAGGEPGFGLFGKFDYIEIRRPISITPTATPPFLQA